MTIDLEDHSETKLNFQKLIELNLYLCINITSVALINTQYLKYTHHSGIGRQQNKKIITIDLYKQDQYTENLTTQS